MTRSPRRRVGRVGGERPLPTNAVNQELDVLVAEYREHATAHAEASEAGDYKEATRHYDGIVRVVRRARSLGNRGEEAMLSLLGDPRPAVRCWAATHCLPIDERASREVLRALSSDPGLVALSARMVLSEWEKGTIELP